MAQLYSNNARSTLTGGILATATSLTVQTLDAPKFPSPTAGDFFDLTLQDSTNIEIVRVTARTGGTMTISTRGLEGTTPFAFPINSVAGLRLTAAVTAVAMNHIPVAAGAHAASAISNTPAGNLVAITVQAALNELDSEKAEIGANSSITSLGPTTTISARILGYKDIPQRSSSADYTFTLDDASLHLLHPSADTTARTFTIPANAALPFAIGTAITIVNQNGAGVVTIAITTDVLRLAGQGTTGSRALAANGVATILKITATEWIISGTGLS